MSEHHGRFIWYELMTTDPAAAKRFYGDVVGWTAQDMPTPGDEGMTYTILNADGNGVGGLMAIPPEAKAHNAPPCWTGYIAVDDTDAMAQKIKAKGGSVIREPADIPGIGRFAVVADPHGAVFEIMTPLPMDPPRAEVPAGTIGHAGWRELFAGDLEQDFAFYAELFGWKKDQPYDMGPMGTYQLFANQDGVVGGVMNKPSGFQGMGWRYYFRVGPIEAAAQRVKAAGGQVANGPMEVPGGDWVLQGVDPQGAEFALVGTKG